MSEFQNELLTREIIDRIHDSADGSSCTRLDGDPFIIVDGWGDLSKINEIINSTYRAEDWAKWEPKFREQWERDQDERREKGWYVNSYNPDIYGSLRLKNEPEESGGDHRWGIRNTSYTPGDLLHLDDICDWGFSDEYTTCSGCYNALRTSPDSYHWQMDGVILEHEILCGDCVRDDPDTYIEYCQNANRLLNEDLVDLTEQGFTDLELSMESGLHLGQNDDPNLVLKIRKQRFPFADIVFTGSVGQFDVSWTAWVRPELNAADDLGEWVNNPELFQKFIYRLFYREYMSPVRGIADEVKESLQAMSIASKRERAAA